MIVAKSFLLIMKITKTILFNLLFLIVALLFSIGFKPIFSASVPPELVQGNPTCQSLGYQYEFKISPPNSGTYYLFGDVGSITVTTTGQGTFDWSSTFAIDAVIAKGGPNANVYKYDPPSESFSDINLSTPINQQNNKPYGLGHISFCFDIDHLQIFKTATTSYDRTWNWDIEKTANQSDFGTINFGEIKTATYTVTLSATSTDSNWNVSGTITIFNATTNPAAIIQSVSDFLNFSGTATVTCGVSFPYTLPGGQTLICTYSKNVNGTNDSLNTVEVMAITYYGTTTNSSVLIGGGVTAPVIWGNPNQIDECVTVNDSNSNGPKNQIICNTDLTNNSYTFNYSVTFSKDQNSDVIWQCNQTEYQNTASFIASDTYTASSSSWIIRGNIECQTQQFCAFSQGYWFAKPNVVWPDVNGGNYGQVTIGGFDYTQNEGKTIWNTSNKGGIKTVKKAFLQVAAIKLSGGTSNNLPASVWADIQLIESWLNQFGKLNLNNFPSIKDQAVFSAAGRLGDWIDQNHCSD